MEQDRQLYESPLELSKAIIDSPLYKPPSKKQRQRVKRRIDREFRKQSAPVVNRKIICRRLTAGAAALLLAGSVTYALRGEIGNLFIQKHEDYISATNQGQGGGVMDTCGGYYPLYTPDGFIPDRDSRVNGDMGILNYIKDHQYFTLSWLSGGSSLIGDYLQEEGAETVMIGGKEGILSKRDGYLRLVWNINPQFILSGNIDSTELVQIAESVVYVPKKDADIKE